MKAKEEDTAKKKPTGNLLRDIMSGSLMTDQIILRNLGFMGMLTVLGALYIANRFHAERVTRDTLKLQKEVRELRAESLATSADLMYASRQSEVFRLVKERELGLEELREPPFRIIVSRKIE
jgi:hypothetical protein